ncbi:MAG: DMT family transporter [Pseudomonadota bacterium]
MPAFSAHIAEWQHRPAYGIGLFVANLLLMAVLGAMVKALSAHFPLTEILTFRFTIAALAFAIILPAAGGLVALKTNRPWGHAVRTCSGIASLGLFFYALANIPLADATALTYSAPIFIVVLSIPLLGETIGWRRWCAVAAGFVGMLLIAQPGLGDVSMGALAAAGSAVTAALVSISLRRLSKTEKTVTIGFYYNCVGALVYGSWTLIAGWVTPSGTHLMLLLLFGAIASVQQWALTHSHRYAEASLLAPFEYLVLIFAAALGYFIWGEVPSVTTWLGAATIAASGLFIIARKRARDAQDASS